MFFAEMWNAWKQRPCAFTDRQPQRRKGPQRPPLFLEPLEDRLAPSADLVTVSAVAGSTPFSESQQNLTLTASVTDATNPSTTVNEGTVSFTVMNASGDTVGSTVQGTVSNGSATAPFTLPAGEAVGNYTIDLSYTDTPDNFTDNGTDTPATLAVSAASTTTTASDATATFSSSAQNVTLNTTVTSSGGTVNEGRVTFTILQGTTVIGTATSGTVSSGSATVNYALPAGTAAGSYTIEADYNDRSGTFDLSSDTSHTLTVTPAKVTTTVANASAVYSPNPQTLTLNADVADASIPTHTVDEGTLTFTVEQGSTTLGSVQATVSSGKASTSFSLPAAQAAGSYIIAVSYGDSAGNFTDNGDTSATLTVRPALVTISTAAAGTTFSTLAQTVTLNAIVADTSIPSDAVDEGVVTFTIKHGSTIFGSVQAAVSGGTACAGFSLPPGQAAGRYTIAVSYSDSQGNFTDIRDTNATLTVSAAATTAQITQVSLTPNFSALTVTETLTAHVSSSSPVTQGTVTFTLSNHTVSANVDANGNATASLTMPLLEVAFELGGWLTSDNAPAGLALTILGLVIPQVIGISYDDPTNNRTASMDTESAWWSPINVELPSTSAFTPSGQIVAANAYTFGLFTVIYSEEGLVLEIGFARFHLTYSYNASNQLIQLTLDGVALLP